MEHHADDIFISDMCGNVCGDSTADGNEIADDNESENEGPLLGRVWGVCQPITQGEMGYGKREDRVNHGEKQIIQQKWSVEGDDY